MNEFAKKIEGLIDNQISKFEESPIKQTIKMIVLLFVIKKVYSWLKEDNNE